jgi:predicted AAA+ superfamily ATPase
MRVYNKINDLEKVIIELDVEDDIADAVIFFDNINLSKVIVIHGQRRVGKTTLINALLDRFEGMGPISEQVYPPNISGENILSVEIRYNNNIFK